jgi:hypothetical protein
MTCRLHDTHWHTPNSFQRVFKMKPNTVVEYFHQMTNRLLIESRGCKFVALARPTEWSQNSEWNLIPFPKNILDLIICVSMRSRARGWPGIGKREEFRGERKVESNVHLVKRPDPRIRGAGDDRAWHITSPVDWQTGIVSAVTVRSEGSDVQLWVERSSVRMTFESPSVITFVQFRQICRSNSYLLCSAWIR